MENIIFCGGCGTFISAAEISTGKAFKINNIYYCQKCSTGTQPAPARQAPAPQMQSRPIQARPAGPAAGQPQIKRPAPQPTVAVPLQQKPGVAPSQARPASPAPRPQTPVQAQKPPAARPAAPAARLNDTVPINQPAHPAGLPPKGVTRPMPSQKATPPQPPARPSQTSRLRPVIKEEPADINEDDFEEGTVTSRRHFGPVKTSKGGIKKIYLISGAAVVVLIIAILVITSISNASKQKAEEARQATLKKHYNEIVDAERDYPNDPQKVIEQIKKWTDKLKGTDYEQKIKEMEDAAKARIEIMDKMKEMEKPVDTVAEIEKRIKEISLVKNDPAVNESLGNRLKDILAQFTKQKKALIEAEKNASAAQEAAEKKAYEDFKTKIADLKNKKDWKAIIKECDAFLGRPNGLQYQEEVDGIKEEAKEAIEELAARIRQRKELQVLNDDISKWERSGDSKAEIYVDEENKIILKNSNSSSNRGAVASITNNNSGENWKDFTMTVEFKVLSGSFNMFLRGGNQSINIPGYGVVNVFSGIPIPFPRKFGKDEWQKYTIELKGKKLTISGTGLSEPKTSDIPEGAGGIGINVNGGDNIIVKRLEAKIIE